MSNEYQSRERHRVKYAEFMISSPFFSRLFLTSISTKIRSVYGIILHYLYARVNAFAQRKYAFYILSYIKPL